MGLPLCNCHGGHGAVRGVRARIPGIRSCAASLHNDCNMMWHLFCASNARLSAISIWVLRHLLCRNVSHANETGRVHEVVEMCDHERNDGSVMLLARSHSVSYRVKCCYV